MTKPAQDFDTFYKSYLSAHTKLATRIIHMLSLVLVVYVVTYVLLSGKERFLFYVPLVGFGLPWLSHLLFEKSRPVGTKAPLWTFRAGLRMAKELIRTGH